MFPATPVVERFDVGRVFASILDLVRTNFGVLFGVIVLVSVVSTAFEYGARYALGMGAVATPAELSPVQVIYTVFALMLGLAQVVFDYAVVTWAGLRRGMNASVSFGDALAEGLRRLLPSLGLMVIMGIALFLAYVFFVIPALILATIWAVALPVMMNEGKGLFDSLSRSADMTRDNRWRIFAVIAVVGIVNLVLFFLVFGVLGVFSLDLIRSGPGTSPILLFLFAVGSSAVGAVFHIGNGSVSPAVYMELKRIREGRIGVASVFD